MKTLTTKATEITNFSLFREYVHNCDNAQLMSLAIAVNYANVRGHFIYGSYCDTVKETLKKHKPDMVGTMIILDMCICVGQELIKRVVNGTFDENEIVARRTRIKE
jgi:hypothetical protein